MAQPASAETIDIHVNEAKIPVLSTVATQAIRLINGGRASANDLEKVIRVDHSLTVQILRLANSPLFASRVKIASINQAVVRLGMRYLNSVVLAAASGDIYDKKDAYAKAFWEHSIAVAFACSWLSTKTKIGSPDECFVAGMLHDVGKVVIYSQEPKFYAGVIDSASDAGKRFYKHERERMNFCTHETIGALIARKWDIRPEIVEAIRFHHEIEDNEDAIDDLNKPIVCLVSVANLIASKLGMGPEDPTIIDLDMATPAKIIGFKETDFDTCSEELKPLIEEQLAAFG